VYTCKIILKARSHEVLHLQGVRRRLKSYFRFSFFLCGVQTEPNTVKPKFYSVCKNTTEPIK
jgi:hypothetical protein